MAPLPSLEVGFQVATIFKIVQLESMGNCIEHLLQGIASPIPPMYWIIELRYDCNTFLG